MSFGRSTLSVLGKVGIVLSVIIIFLFGFIGTVYLSLRTSEVKVPDILGKDRSTAENMLTDVGLNIRIRGTRPSLDKQPNTILSQLPEAGQVVKAGIPVAVEISRAPKEGESVASSTPEATPETDKPTDNANANQPAATNQNQNQNQNKPKNKNKNFNNANNRNANNSNNANNANANRNANNRNTGVTRNTNNSNRNANTTTPNANRSNTNANKRPPATTAPTGANRGTP